jgi:hypothetical protein
VSSIEELLGRKSSGSGLESQEYGLFLDTKDGGDFFFRKKKKMVEF